MSAVIRCQRCETTTVFVDAAAGLLALGDGRCWHCGTLALTLEQLIDRSRWDPTAADVRFLRAIRVSPQ